MLSGRDIYFIFYAVYIAGTLNDNTQPASIRLLCFTFFTLIVLIVLPWNQKTGRIK